MKSSILRTIASLRVVCFHGVFSCSVLLGGAAFLTGATALAAENNSSAAQAASSTPTTPQQQLSELGQLFELRNEAQTHFEKLKERIGAKSFNEQIDKGRIRFKSDLGIVKLTLIDKQPVERVIPANSEKAYVFVDKNRISGLSEHLFKIYIPRQHIDAGSNRTDGQHGRDVVLVWTDNEKLASSKEIPRPRAWSPQWWKQYWRATYKKPTANDVRFGLVNAAIQVGFAGAVSGANILLDPSKPFFFEPMLLNAAFGSVIGSFSSTYQNWVYRTGNKSDSHFKVRAKQVLKSSLVSVVYAYSLVAMTSGGINVMNFLSLSALQSHAHVWTNILFNNIAKVEFAQWAKILESKRIDGKNLTIKLPFTEKRWDTGFTRRQVNFQILSYVPVNTLRTADLIGVSFAGVPIGKLMLWLSAPVTKFLTLKWAEKYHPEQAKKMRLRESWNRFVRAPVDIPKRLFKRATGAQSFRCERVLTSPIFQ